jgi:uncharacterized protein
MTRTDSITQIIANEIGAKTAQVAAAIALLDEGATVPFIARYRKEATGGLDDGQLRTLAERLPYLRELDDRRDAILKSIREQDRLTDTLARAIETAETKAALDDLYLPYRPKRRTKAMVARENGLEALRDAILAQRGADPTALAARFVSDAVPNAQEALDGARDILVEDLAETAELLGELRTSLRKDAVITTKVLKGQQEKGAKISDYFDRTETWATMPGHRALALLRAVSEGVIRVDVGPDGEAGVARCERTVAARLKPTGQGPGDRWLRDVAAHAWKAKLSGAMENELLAGLRARAEEEAIAVFGKNLKDLLLSAPAGAVPTLGLDPGIRTGVKAAAVDATGKVLATDTLYPFQPRQDLRDAQASIIELVRRHHIALIAIGNGTASRETEAMATEALRALPKEVAKPKVVIVSEAGASVYSASALAAEELPDLDVSLRGAVSIARRLQDPLSELVKIEPKAIGVGQYQHDVDQKALTRALDAVVEDAVNAVGVDLNTASPALLSHVAGLTPALAKAIVAHRDRNGAFRSRAELLKVKGLGPKAFEQCAGFLRIRDGKEPLDASSVHPETYDLARQIVLACGRDLKAIHADPAPLKSVKAETFVSGRFGLPTVRDILAELEKPGRDPRPSFKTATFAEGVNVITDLRVGMRLEGTVTNVAAFGAFVDIGVHQDGLVHVSQLADRFVKDPHEVVKTGDIVQVRVLEVDVARKRIGLSMRREATDAGAQPGARGDTTSARDAVSSPKRTPAKASQSSSPAASVTPSAPTGAFGAALLDAIKRK